MDKFSELKAAALAATPGPWFRSGVQFNGITTEQSVITQGNKPHVASSIEKRDAIFIAEANPTAVLALLAELEKSQQRIAELEAEVKVWVSAAEKRLSAQQARPENAKVGDMPFLGSAEPAYIRGWNDRDAASPAQSASDKSEVTK